MANPEITLVEVEAQIGLLQHQIAELRETGIRLDDARSMPGVEARAWLMRFGATDIEATATIVRVINERRASAGAPPIGQCARSTRPNPSSGGDPR